VYQWFAELQLFQGKDRQGKTEKTLRAYNYRLGFFLDFTVQNRHIPMALLMIVPLAQKRRRIQAP
jgi:hypothetical protein